MSPCGPCLPGTLRVHSCCGEQSNDSHGRQQSHPCTGHLRRTYFSCFCVWHIWVSFRGLLGRFRVCQDGPALSAVAIVVCAGQCSSLGSDRCLSPAGHTDVSSLGSDRCLSPAGHTDVSSLVKAGTLPAAPTSLLGGPPAQDTVRGGNRCLRRTVF